MIEADRTRFTSFLGKEARTYYPAGGKLEIERANGYFDELLDFDFDILEAAFKALRREGDFLPTIKAITTCIKASHTNRAQLAWQTMTRVIEEGEMCSLFAVDAAIAYALQSMGGWLVFVRLIRGDKPEMFANHMKEFIGYYEIASKGWQQPVTQYFPGHAERENREHTGRLSQWVQKTGQQLVVLPVLVVVTDGYQSYQVPFDPHTMVMDAAARQRLSAGPEAMKAYEFIPPTDRPAIVGDSEPVGPEMRKQIVERLRLLTAGSAPRRNDEDDEFKGVSTADQLAASVEVQHE